MAAVGIIGAGTWGTALAVLLNNNGHDVTIWSAFDTEIQEMSRTRRHKNLPEVVLPDQIQMTADLRTAMAEKDMLIMAVPSVYVRSTAAKMKEYLRYGQIVVDVAKGIEEQSLMTPHASTTGNRTVDAVLGFEKAVAREKKIEVEESISIPREMEVADSVLCGILGNALDNAIEACDRVSERERLVKIFMKVERKNLFIEIKNRYDGTIFESQDGRLISRKDNPQEHGMGLRIMHELLEHADGNVETMWDEQMFTLRVMIYHVI